MGFLNKKALAGIALASTLMLGGCYDDGYGYGGVGVGYGGYDDGYYGGGPYGYAGGYPSYGWYDGFYYPGNGYYVYDRGGGRQRWNDGQRRHWESRRGLAGRPGDGRWQGRDRPRDGQAGIDRPGRPGGARWQGRPDRPVAGQPDTVRPGLTPGTPGGWNRPDRAARA
ncbi:peptidase, partial [Sphingomonas solaris]